MDLIYQEKLNLLGELLNFSAKCLKHSTSKRIRKKKQLFWEMFIVSHNITESILCLCKEGRSHSCLILLRTIYENFINAKFLFACPNSKNLHVLLRDSLIEREKQLEHAIRFKREYLNDSTIQTDIPALQSCLTDIKKEIAKSNIKINKYPGSIILSAVDRAKKVDEYNKKKNLNSASLEEWYILIYRHLSSYTHLNHTARNKFFKQDPGGNIEVFLSGNPNDTEIILEQAIHLLRELISMFLAVFENPFKKEFITKHKKINSLKNQ